MSFVRGGGEGGPELLEGCLDGSGSALSCEVSGILLAGLSASTGPPALLEFVPVDDQQAEA